MEYGTNYFPSIGHAVVYYRRHAGWTGNVVKDIQESLNEEFIHIGKPPLKPGQSHFIKDSRYWIKETEAILTRCAICGESPGITDGKCKSCWDKWYAPKAHETSNRAALLSKHKLSPVQTVRSLLTIDGYCVLIEKMGEWKSLYHGDDLLQAGRLYDEIECTRKLFKLKCGKLTIIQEQHVDETEFVHNAMMKEKELRCQQLKG